MNLAKVQLKVKAEKTQVWIHFCYVPFSLKKRFEREVSVKTPFNVWVRKWAKDDFGIDDLNSEEQIQLLKDAIRGMYKSRYPEVFIDSPTDNQGWVRVWCTNHIEQELKNYE